MANNTVYLHLERHNPASEPIPRADRVPGIRVSIIRGRVTTTNAILDIEVTGRPGSLKRFMTQCHEGGYRVDHL